MSRLRRTLLIVGALSVLPPLHGEERAALPRADQMLLGIAADWSSTTGTLHAFHRDAAGRWKASFQQPVPVLFGRGGLAWGRGALPVPEGARKAEGDRKAPAGYFRIGRVFGFEGALPRGSDPSFPYRQVSQWDAWPDDPRNPYYNRHFVADPAKGIPAWFESQKMRRGDPAYHWLIEIRHNADPKPVSGAGSAIFFHTRRGPERTSHGCTVMARGDLENILRWLRADANPHYVLLPRAEYFRYREAWDLPAIDP